MNSHFITLEGSEGVGKSTALSFIKKYFSEKKIDFVLTREPGGTPLGESIRAMLLANENVTLTSDAELLLMFAARAQHIAEVIKPALLQNKVVISDRFTDSSFAYQGGGRQIPSNRIETLAKWVQGDLEPDLTLLLDADVHIGLGRINRPGGKDRIEHEPTAFFQRVREAYLSRAKQFPKRFVIIDATQSIDQVQLQIKNALDKLLCATDTPCKETR